MTIGQKTKKLLKVKNVKKMPKKLKIFSLKIHKNAGILKNLKIFLNKGTMHKIFFM